MRQRIVVALGMVAMACAAPVRAGNLGIANSFTEFSFGDSFRYGDSTGRVAVGGNATFNNFSIGSALSGGGNALVVGGELEGSQTNINGGGNASYGSKSSGTNLYFNDGGMGIQQPSPISFSSAETYLKSLSTTLENTPATDNTVVQSGGVTLMGTSTTLDVFNLSGAVLSAATGLTINVPSTATVVVNIDGTTVGMQNFGITLNNGLSESHVLYNFDQATSLTISGIQLEGSVLAPLANISFYGGQINGTMIGNEINSNPNTYASGESHYDPFTGTLPDISTVPEPTSMVMMLTAGALGVIPLARRWMRQTA